MDLRNRKDMTIYVILLLLYKLGSAIGWRSAKCSQKLTRDKYIGETKVDNFDVKVAIEEQIFRL